MYVRLNVLSREEYKIHMDTEALVSDVSDRPSWGQSYTGIIWTISQIKMFFSGQVETIGF